MSLKARGWRWAWIGVIDEYALTPGALAMALWMTVLYLLIHRP